MISTDPLTLGERIPVERAHSYSRDHSYNG